CARYDYYAMDYW
nr:immunoglobulin heavy chain junction region [Mus musculus]MBK4186778.1 immunoglobulin heavy chain junction region [Mus musculus]MBK4186779.1 immunoglobulin heavy chain junction region [Mus musculus]MBK4196021.1 immunoglobulin heavy chain junction region [Mus musculus]MBK4196022.1 immunoglobulin heavy chain junction region [Mus musculus]